MVSDAMLPSVVMLIVVIGQHCYLNVVLLNVMAPIMQAWLIAFQLRRCADFNLTSFFNFFSQ
jgi:hypothetical protein